MDKSDMCEALMVIGGVSSWRVNLSTGMPVQIVEDVEARFLLALSWHLTDVINQNWSAAATPVSPQLFGVPPRQKGFYMNSTRCR